MEIEETIYRSLLKLNERPSESKKLLDLILEIDKSNVEGVLEEMKSQKLVTQISTTPQYIINQIKGKDWISSYERELTENGWINPSMTNKEIIFITKKVLLEREGYYNPREAIWIKLGENRKSKINELLLQVLNQDNNERIISKNPDNRLEIMLTAAGELIQEEDFDNDGKYIKVMQPKKTSLKEKINKHMDIVIKVSKYLAVIASVVYFVYQKWGFIMSFFK
jgi:hypothetical protein